MEKIKGCNLILILFITILVSKTILGLGASPGRFEINFKPGYEGVIDYTIFEDDPNKEVILSVRGDLSEYVKLNKKSITGSGDFIATIKLPDKIEKPGKHGIYIVAREKVDEELVSTIGTSVTVGVVIVVNVPYPGKYLEVELSSKNANVGEPVDFFLKITSKGIENLSIQPKIQINSSKGFVETLYFNSREIKSQEEIELKKSLDTKGYNPGKYNALAVVDYGEKTAKAESDFRIGELVINIINYTNKIVIGGVKAFEINIESGWNDNIDTVSAEVSIDNLGTPINFKTEASELTPWELKTIKGYFDTENFTKGIYDANITLSYFGKNQGRSNSKLVKIEFVEKISLTLILIIVSGSIILLILIIIVIIKYFHKNKKRK